MNDVNTKLQALRQQSKFYHMVLYITKTRHAMYRKFFVFKNEKNHWTNFDIFLIFAQNIDCGYTLEPPRRIPLHTPVLLYKSGVSGGFHCTDMFSCVMVDQPYLIMAYDLDMNNSHVYAQFSLTHGYFVFCRTLRMYNNVGILFVYFVLHDQLMSCKI